MTEALQVDRRRFLGGAGAVVLTLVCGDRGIARTFGVPEPVATEQVFSAWLSIDARGMVTLVNAEAEMGQGTNTAMAMLVAEELEIPWGRITTVPMTARPIYTNPAFGMLKTGASLSLKGRYLQLRQLGAAARQMLVQAAAQEWKVPSQACRAVAGEVHGPDGRSMPYSSLVAGAASLPVPQDVPLKPRADWAILGKPQARIDMADKCTGKARYGFDKTVPGMVQAALVHAPQFGARVKAVDSKAALAVAGVTRVIALDYAVACIASTSWSALQGADALVIEWENPDPAAVIDDAKIDAMLRDGVAGKVQGRNGLIPAHKVGDPAAGFAQPGVLAVSAEYSTPYLDHACMEPTSAIAHVRPDGIDIWSSTQSPAMIYHAAKLLYGFEADKVRVHQQPIGSSFGRRAQIDGELEAMVLSRIIGGPVRAIRSRSEDIQHGFYRPASRSALRGAVKDGKIVAWSHRCASQSLLDNYARYFREYGIDLKELDKLTGPAGASGFNFAPFDLMSVDGTPSNAVYAIPNVEVASAKIDVPIPTGWFRGVGQTNNLFATECFVDELAYAAGQDPLAFRKTLLSGQPRFLAALDCAAREIGWDKKPAKGIGRGIAITNMSDAVTVAIVEVAASKSGFEIRRVVLAVDNGIVINPDVVEAQTQGGFLFGLGAALWGRISIAEGRVEQTGFADYRLLTLQHCPALTVIQMPSDDPPSTISEAAATVAAPALANAIFAANGRRLRDLPIARNDFECRATVA
ncbi:CO/xanthine dehydrogenase Mo-binding subunit [Novosphingobium sp. SG751A]|uniref:xanthine dehydrogenase family protein molybdopterin-binding subunit n=1 Tax=Novosphingobium sp. SG751A TaxID=2587000 RepID=UPI0015536D92|nr:molybdopterin cofactor-binding domain-containing protein [Novosphingobium sp. SG751A]NOW48770.1 CO/xanthine dehydrogenase Mo-binding subunit [Novosphingobium sp. SG751A]